MSRRRGRVGGVDDEGVLLFKVVVSNAGSYYLMWPTSSAPRRRCETEPGRDTKRGSPLKAFGAKVTSRLPSVVTVVVVLLVWRFIVATRGSEGLMLVVGKGATVLRLTERGVVLDEKAREETPR